MSSADSNLLAAGAIFSNDLYRVVFRPTASDSELLSVTRWTMGVVALFSLGVALLDVKDMLTVLMFSFSLRAGGIFVPYVVGHFWRRATPSAALGAMVVGSVLVVLVDEGIVEVWGLGAVIPAVSGSLATLCLLTWFTGRDEPRSADGIPG